MAGKTGYDGLIHTVGLNRDVAITLGLDIWATCGKTKPIFLGIQITI
jgi:hypothetical protein